MFKEFYITLFNKFSISNLSLFSILVMVISLFCLSNLIELLDQIVKPNISILYRDILFILYRRRIKVYEIYKLGYYLIENLIVTTLLALTSIILMILFIGKLTNMDLYINISVPNIIFSLFIFINLYLLWISLTLLILCSRNIKLINISYTKYCMIKETLFLTNKKKLLSTFIRTNYKSQFLISYISFILLIFIYVYIIITLN